MAEGLNKAFLIGNLGVDPEIKYTQSGRAKLRLSVATNRGYQDKDGQRQEVTEWHKVAVWGKRAEGLNKILAKGDRVGVEGRIEHRAWEDDNGVRRSLTEIVASEIILLGSPRGRVSADAGGNGASASAPAAEDIPF